MAGALPVDTGLSPVADIVNPGGWTTAPLWSDIDDLTTAPDAAVITSPSNPKSPDFFECDLTAETDEIASIQISHMARKSSGAKNLSITTEVRVKGDESIIQTHTTSLLTTSLQRYEAPLVDAFVAANEPLKIHVSMVSSGKGSPAAGEIDAITVDVGTQTPVVTGQPYSLRVAHVAGAISGARPGGT